VHDSNAEGLKSTALSHGEAFIARLSADKTTWNFTQAITGGFGPCLFSFSFRRCGG
jgi:hypothetical protein